MQAEHVDGIVLMARAVCHEFSQPLQAMSGYMEMARMCEDQVKSKEYINKALAEMERTKSLLMKTHSLLAENATIKTRTLGKLEIVDMEGINEPNEH